jgi:hypothetical protein
MTHKLTRPQPIGYLVLFHLQPPFKHAKHAYDWVEYRHGHNVIRDRIAALYEGNAPGATSLLRHAIMNGSKLVLARKWHGTRSQLKDVRAGGNAIKHCEECRTRTRMKRQDGRLAELLEESIRRKS